MDRIQPHIRVLVGCCDKVGDLPPLNETKRMQPIGLLFSGCLLVINRDLMLGQQCLMDGIQNRRINFRWHKRQGGRYIAHLVRPPGIGIVG